MLLAVGVMLLVGVTVGVRVGVMYCTAGGSNVTPGARLLRLQADAVSRVDTSPVQESSHFAIDKVVFFWLG